VESVDWSVGIWRRAKGSFKIRMHDLVRDLEDKSADRSYLFAYVVQTIK
ncbi:hypothetical protein SUGI_1462320, partial [Cryptomeria japonica]